MHFDYEALHPVVWKHLYSWYSADIQIVRPLKKDVLNRRAMVLDLYPSESNKSTIAVDREDCEYYQSRKHIIGAPIRYTRPLRKSDHFKY